MIREATKNDGEQIIPLILIILEDMELPFLRKHGRETVTEILKLAYLDETFRYSYKRAIVLEKEAEILGVAYGYLDKEEDIIDLPLTPILKRFEISESERMFDDKEAFPDEWYLDSIAVRDDQRGQGIGSALLDALPEFVKNSGASHLGLSCDEANPQAKKLYLRQGFEVVGQTMISGHRYDHMQKVI